MDYMTIDQHNNNNNNPAGTIPPQRIVVWEFLGPTYGYEEIGIKCADQKFRNGL